MRYFGPESRTLSVGWSLLVRASHPLYATSSTTSYNFFSCLVHRLQVRARVRLPIRSLPRMVQPPPALGRRAVSSASLPCSRRSLINELSLGPPFTSRYPRCSTARMRPVDVCSCIITRNSIYPAIYISCHDMHDTASARLAH